MAVLGALCDDGRRVPAVTVFGWDDVLCPTTHAKLERKKRATQPLGASSSKQDRKELLKVGTSVVRCVQAARRHGPVVIVTESDETWVRGTAELLLPGSAAACLQNVEVVSSRGRFGTDFPCQPACWQIAAFSYVTNRYLLSPAASAEVGLGLESSDAKTAAAATKGRVAAKGVVAKGGVITKDVVAKDIVTTGAETENVLTKDVLTKDVLSIGTETATTATTTTTTTTVTATATTDTGGGGSGARQEGRGGGVEGSNGGGGGVGVSVSDDADGAAGSAAPPRGGGNGDCKGGNGDGSINGSGGGDDDGRIGSDGGVDGASAGRNWGRGTLIAVSTAPRVWEDKSATSTLREHHPKIVAKTVSLIQAPTPLELRKQLDLLAENFGLMFGHPPPRNRARGSSRNRSRSRSRSRAAKTKPSSSTSPSPVPSPSPSSSSSSSTTLSSSSLSSSSPEASPREDSGGGVDGVGGVGGGGFTQKKGIGDSDEDYAAATSSTATSSTATSSTAGRSVDGEMPSPGSSDWDEPPRVMRGRAGGRGGDCASGLEGARGTKEVPTVAAVAAAAGGPW